MNNYNWQELLVSWNNEVFMSSLVMRIEEQKLNSRWLGNIEASESQIRALEKRLSVVLPSSIRSFLSFSNGWNGPLSYVVKKIFGTEDIVQMTKHKPELIERCIDAYNNEEFYIQDFTEASMESKTSINFKDEYLKSAVVLAENDEYGLPRFILGIPALRTTNDEWEIWELSERDAEILRYESFWEYMQDLKKGFYLTEKGNILRYKQVNNISDQSS